MELALEKDWVNARTSLTAYQQRKQIRQFSVHPLIVKQINLQCIQLSEKSLKYKDLHIKLTTNTCTLNRQLTRNFTPIYVQLTQIWRKNGCTYKRYRFGINIYTYTGLDLIIKTYGKHRTYTRHNVACDTKQWRLNFYIPIKFHIFTTSIYIYNSYIQ